MNDYAEVTNKLTPILSLSHETGSTVLLVHHAGKGRSRRNRCGAGIHSARGGSVDNVFLFARTERYRLLSSTQRIGPDLPQTLVQLNDTTWCASRGLSREAADVEALKADIVAVVRETPGLTEPEVLKQIEGATALKRKALRVLLQEGLQRAGSGRRGDPIDMLVCVFQGVSANKKTRNQNSRIRPINRPPILVLTIDRVRRYPAEYPNKKSRSLPLLARMSGRSRSRCSRTCLKPPPWRFCVTSSTRALP